GHVEALAGGPPKWWTLYADLHHFTQCHSGGCAAGSLNHFMPIVARSRLAASCTAEGGPGLLDRSVASPPRRCAHRPVPVTDHLRKGNRTMITLGIDAHKRTHTVVAVGEHGRQLGTRTTNATTPTDRLAMVQWADQF